MAKTLLPSKIKDARLIPWRKVAPASVFKLRNGSKAGVVVDQEGVPYFFVFNTGALLDVLSEIDEALVDRLSHKDYYSKKVNPSGWLIDKIESSLPLKKEYVKSLHTALKEANKKGWVSLSEISKEFDLA